MLNLWVLKTYHGDDKSHCKGLQKTVDLTLTSEWNGKAFLEIICLLLLMALMVRHLTAHFSLHALCWYAYYSILHIYVYFHGTYLKFPFQSTTVKNWQIRFKNLPVLVFKRSNISFTGYFPLILLIHFFSFKITHSEIFFKVIPALHDTFKS